MDSKLLSLFARCVSEVHLAIPRLFSLLPGFGAGLRMRDWILERCYTRQAGMAWALIVSGIKFRRLLEIS